MKITLAFDVYGTLVDPAGMAKHLAHDVGAKRLSLQITGERDNSNTVFGAV
jgi:hypothetical protein